MKRETLLLTGATGEAGLPSSGAARPPNAQAVALDASPQAVEADLLRYPGRKVETKGCCVSKDGREA